VRVYDPKTFTLLQTLKDTASWYAGEKEIFYVDISPDDKYIALASNNNFYTVWDWQSGKVVKREEFPLVMPSQTYDQVHIDMARFTPDGKFLDISGYYNYTVYGKQKVDYIGRVFNVGSWDSVSIYPSVSSFFRYSRSGKTYGYYAGGKIKIWETANNTLIREIPTINTYNTDVAISSDDKYVIITFPDLAMRYIYQIDSGVLISKCFSGSQEHLDVTMNNKYILSSLVDDIYLSIAPWADTYITKNEETMDILYPNPASGSLNISLMLANPLELTASVYSDNGKWLKLLPSAFAWRMPS